MGFNPIDRALAGLLKSLVKEWSDVGFRAVDIGGTVDENEAANIVASELTVRDDPVEIAWTGSNRSQVRTSNAELDRGTSYEVPLDEGDVIVVTGGARGITAEAVVALAERWRPMLVLVGRTRLTQESARYDGLSPQDLKSAITDAIRESGETPDVRRIQDEYLSIIRQREIRRNRGRIRQAGSEVRYVATDAGRNPIFRSALAKIERDHGRIDGLVHGAGVREDRLLTDKDAESFERVIMPKIDGALALIECIPLDQLKLACFFSSSAARYGNAGQCDYAAANDALNGIARWLEPRTSARVVSIGWGPWEAGVGMVDETLARRFEKLDVPMIPRECGVRAFIEELAYGSREDVEVLYE